jgi:hypothetical protein
MKHALLIRLQGSTNGPHPKLEESCPYIIDGDRKLAQPDVWYLVLARNECNGFELVSENVGMAVQKLCKGNNRSRDLNILK